VEVDIQFPGIPIIPHGGLEAFQASLPPIPPGQCCLLYLADLSWATTGRNYDHRVRMEFGQLPPITPTLLSAFQGNIMAPSDMVVYWIWE
jgi:hypothetical protein